MRIPLFRSGSDETPIAPWEWLFAPILTPLFFLFLLVLAAVSVPVGVVYRFRQQRREKQLRLRLAAAGRFVQWAEVEAALRAGAGTLIVEHRSPKGPIRDWWTEDDLIAAALVPLPISLKVPPKEGQLQSLQEFAKACSARYVDIEAGAAKLTDVPVRLDKQLDPRKYVVVDLGDGWMDAIALGTGRNLSQHYPQGKVVTLLAWSDEPLMFKGDSETVFLAPAEPGAAPDPARDLSLGSS